MKPILIDLNDYVRTGEGANGASYNHKTDPDIMMKMYFRNFEAAALELELAKKVYALGIPTPEPGDLVTDGERMGIRFRRIEGKGEMPPLPVARREIAVGRDALKRTYIPKIECIAIVVSLFDIEPYS